MKNPIKIFCETEKVNLITFANLIGVSPSYVSQILKGKRRPSINLMKTIETATHGKITTIEIVNFYLSDEVSPCGR